MTATTHNPTELGISLRSQAAIAALPSLLLPKCFACLHVYGWFTAALFGSPGELCGAPTVSGMTIAVELAIIAVGLAFARRICSAIAACARCGSLYV